jgi:hypothetical protein
MRPGADVETWEAEIQNGLKAIPARAFARGWSEPRWTREVKRVVGVIGTRHGFAVCASGWPKIFYEEWLFDLVWYKNDKNDRLVSVPLVLESEWSLSFEEVKYDFEKLLVAKAQLRILVHQARTKAALEDVQRKLITLVSEFEGSTKGDRYLFAGWDYKTTEFSFRPFTY